MEEIEFETIINQRVNASVNIYTLLDCINELQIEKRWNYIAAIINNIDLQKELDESKKEVVRNFLTKKLASLQEIQNQSNKPQNNY